MRVPERIDTLLRTAVGLTVLTVSIFYHSVIAIFLSGAGASPARVHRQYVSLGRLYLRVAGTRLLVGGSEQIEDDTAYIVVANHESGWDPPCLIAGLPEFVMRFVAGNESMQLPLVGHAMRVTGNIRVWPGQMARNVEQIRKAMDQRDPGVSIVFFAEGSHSPDGALQPFKMGAFATAVRHGLPILPVGISGSRQIWDRRNVRLRRGTVAIEVGAPIPSEGIALESCGELRDRTFAAVAELRTRARARLEATGVDPGEIG